MESKPVFESVGGIHFGTNAFFCFNATWPFGKIEIYNEEILMHVQYLPEFLLRFFFWPRYKVFKVRLPYQKIKSFKAINWFIFGRGVRFKHDSSEYPPYIVFWAIRKRDQKKIMECLTSHGVVREN